METKYLYYTGDKTATLSALRHTEAPKDPYSKDCMEQHKQKGAKEMTKK